MSDEQTRLAELRDRIDSLDKQIMDLISARAQCAQEVAHVKMASRPNEDVFFYRPEREAQVLRRIKAENPGPLSGEEMARLFREIMSACLALEKPMHIAFLGPEGTFTQAAALKHFGHSVVSIPLPAIDDVFREVESGEAHYGVVPVENSTEGMINHTLDMFISSSLKICGEVQLRIHHHLLIADGTDKKAIKRIYSHQQSFAQCRKWLDTHWHEVERVAVSSNAEAARRAASEPGAAAIAGDMAAELYDLRKLAATIEDRPDNTTRFLIIGREEVGPSGHDKSSILVSMRNKPGALYELLEPFHRHGLSLTRLETRPSPSGTWAYVFYIDFEAHADDPQVQTVLQEVDAEAVELKRLGSYPIGVL
ncbi:prephenate dehydratase [Marinobacter nanhaiticus D15-8W]|uniref:Bifunctional chorismate mutase/prephenate dehydratase n=1 Tax=Marinobacter nanhaiticus D15-8W TaxID=626887 RepID=N6X042_9GAMM|nr:prephenate dehydratase [Marinobacter nanhaiticus]ENO14418.1 prephenate dehydratase [Marinobacter nanhaiticus D15-8W]BES71808.1 prephenate dehydratase [Marinobacter nanhaiticus D15-8W]